ncbi:MAG: response regulator [Methanoregulaceae archaeon]|nr:response regulator [Methanoregulaceae archaeon]
MTKILIVDDFCGILELFSSYLTKKCNAEIEVCTSPGEALKKLEAQPFDMVISDYDMREMNGIELLESIRATGRSIPFVLLTGLHEPEIEAEALRHGALYVQKGEHPTRQFESIISLIEGIEAGTA